MSPAAPRARRAPDITLTFLDLLMLMTAFQALSLALAGAQSAEVARVRETFAPHGPAIVALAPPQSPSSRAGAGRDGQDLQYLFTVLAQSFSGVPSDWRPALSLGEDGIVIGLGDGESAPQALGLLAQALAGVRNPVDVVATAPAEAAGAALTRAQSLSERLSRAGLAQPLGRVVRLGDEETTAIAIRR